MSDNESQDASEQQQQLREFWRRMLFDCLLQVFRRRRSSSSERVNNTPAQGGPSNTTISDGSHGIQDPQPESAAPNRLQRSPSQRRSFSGESVNAAQVQAEPSNTTASESDFDIQDLPPLTAFSDRLRQRLPSDDVNNEPVQTGLSHSATSNNGPIFYSHLRPAKGSLGPTNLRQSFSREDFNDTPIQTGALDASVHAISSSTTASNNGSESEDLSPQSISQRAAKQRVPATDSSSPFLSTTGSTSSSGNSPLTSYESSTSESECTFSPPSKIRKTSYIEYLINADITRDRESSASSSSSSSVYQEHRNSTDTDLQSISEDVGGRRESHHRSSSADSVDQLLDGVRRRTSAEEGILRDRPNPTNPETPLRPIPQAPGAIPSYSQRARVLVDNNTENDRNQYFGPPPTVPPPQSYINLHMVGTWGVEVWLPFSGRLFNFYHVVNSPLFREQVFDPWLREGAAVRRGSLGSAGTLFEFLEIMVNRSWASAYSTSEQAPLGFTNPFSDRNALNEEVEGSSGISQDIINTPRQEDRLPGNFVNSGITFEHVEYMEGIDPLDAAPQEDHRPNNSYDSIAYEMSEILNGPDPMDIHQDISKQRIAPKVTYTVCNPDFLPSQERLADDHSFSDNLTTFTRFDGLYGPDSNEAEFSEDDSVYDEDSPEFSQRDKGKEFETTCENVEGTTRDFGYELDIIDEEQYHGPQYHGPEPPDDVEISNEQLLNTPVRYGELDMTRVTPQGFRPEDEDPEDGGRHFTRGQKEKWSTIGGVYYTRRSFESSDSLDSLDDLEASGFYYMTPKPGESSRQGTFGFFGALGINNGIESTKRITTIDKFKDLSAKKPQMGDVNSITTIDKSKHSSTEKSQAQDSRAHEAAVGENHKNITFLDKSMKVHYGRLEITPLPARTTIENDDSSIATGFERHESTRRLLSEQARFDEYPRTGLQCLHEQKHSTLRSRYGPASSFRNSPRQMFLPKIPGVQGIQLEDHTELNSVDSDQSEARMPSGRIRWLLLCCKRFWFRG